MLTFRNSIVLFLPLTFQGGGYENRTLLLIFSFKKCLPLRFRGFAHILTSILYCPLQSVIFFPPEQTLSLRDLNGIPGFTEGWDLESQLSVPTEYLETD